MASPKINTKLPGLVVFDLDDCLWTPEMYTLTEVPDASCAVRGDDGSVVGCRSGSSVITLFPGALAALQRIDSGKYPGLRIAAASSADTPRAVAIGTAALDILEVRKGVTVGDCFRKAFPDKAKGCNLKIGRTVSKT